MKINSSLIAQRYADAIFDVALSENSIDNYLFYLQQINSLLFEKKIVELINNPLFTTKDIINIFNQLLDIKNNNIINFISLLHQNKRFVIFANIFNEFQYLVFDHKNILAVNVESAFAINDIDKKILEENIAKKFNKQIVLTVVINKDLICGVRIKIKDYIINATVKQYITNLSNLIH